MSKANLNFDNIEIKKSAFHSSKYLINIDKVNIEKKVITNKISYGKSGFKYCIDYNDDDRNKPLCTMLAKISEYVKWQTKYESFLIKDEELLKAYNILWNKVSNLIKKEFDSGTVYNI